VPKLHAQGASSSATSPTTDPNLWATPAPTKGDAEGQEKAHAEKETRMGLEKLAASDRKIHPIIRKRSYGAAGIRTQDLAGSRRETGPEPRIIAKLDHGP